MAVFFSFLILYTVGRTPWTGDQPVARLLPTHKTTQAENKRTQTSMPWVGFESTIPAFERSRGHCDGQAGLCPGNKAFLKWRWLHTNPFLPTLMRGAVLLLHHPSYGVELSEAYGQPAFTFGPVLIHFYSVTFRTAVVRCWTLFSIFEVTEVHAFLFLEPSQLFYKMLPAFLRCRVDVFPLILPLCTLSLGVEL
jgi:hypothetical protein